MRERTRAVLICHCLSGERRTGSTFGVQARFRNEQISDLVGRSAQYERVADSDNTVTFNFCPNCGATLHWRLSAYPGLTVVAVGAFADRGFPPPGFSVFEAEQHSSTTKVGAASSA
jgi:hypothetical protein